jgi:chromosome segregation ATPase
VLLRRARTCHSALCDLIVFAGIPRLFDLVKVKDTRLLPAFYFALGNTLAAGDLEQATRIAYGNDRRWRRVVTLQVWAETSSECLS